VGAIAPFWSLVGVAGMFPRAKWISAGALAAVAAAGTATPARAGVGDLLVAPTRIVLDGRKGAEIILNNIGDEPATYRVSVEFRRMTEAGDLTDVAEPSAADRSASEMIVYAPRKITLAPHEPQSIRIAARPPQGLPDGEYRVHMLFRAIPPAVPVSASADTPAKGLQFKLTPVYGVTIPVIVRLGNLDAKAGISNVRLEQKDGASAVALDLSRSGARSTFGEVRVLKSGVKEPIAIQKGVAVYTEIDKRRMAVPVSPGYKGGVAGPVTVQYLETFDDGAKVIAETQAVLR
jgi:P pilus assembly chaperone PapD